jgi:hypothetical protein
MTMQYIFVLVNLPKCKSGPIRGVASLEGNNLVVFYYFGVSEIWSMVGVALVRFSFILRFLPLSPCDLLYERRYLFNIFFLQFLIKKYLP